MDEIENIEILKGGAETLGGAGEGGGIGQADRVAAPEAPADSETAAPGPPPRPPLEASTQPGAFDAAIPWRGLPSLPSAGPLVAGVLQGAREADDSGAPDSPEFTAVEDELVLGAKFSQYGPVYFFTAGQVEAGDVAPGKMVLVDTEQGVALAEVVTARRLRLPLPKICTEEGLEVEIKPIRGLAGAADIAAAADNRILAAGARMFCRQCIRERALDMKLVEVEVLHDRSKIIFYFTAPTRIDFRELVKDLVRNYHTRIELRQIGVRHETQMIGALGNCGMTCCCRRYLRKFAPVTIKMAKEQNLFLNPAKLSGMCGRLLCCLAYEQENYDEFHKRSPKIGKKYKTDSGIVKVMRANLFRQSIFVLDEANVESEYQLDEWEALHPLRFDQPGPAGLPEPADESERRQEPWPERLADEGALPERGGEFTAAALADTGESGPDGDAKAAKSIFGLPGSRYAGPPGSAAPMSGAAHNGAEGGRRNDNQKYGDRHKPSKQGRNPGGGQA